MVSEALLVASAHMQMNNVTVGRTGLSTFREDVILFPQELGRLVERHDMLGRYHLDNCANSQRGPGAARQAHGDADTECEVRRSD